MELQDESLVITGNLKGYLEIYHLIKRQLFARESAHKDPIDALKARDNYICTVVYGSRSSLKVWMMIKGGKIVLTYCLEDELEIEFSTFTLSNDALILGDARSQELHFISLVSERKHSQLLRDKPGQVMFMDVMENLVFAATVEDNIVGLHVYEQLDFDHLLTFHFKNIEWVSSIVVLRNHNTLKFLVGGSALAVLKLDFNTEKTNASHKEQEKIENREGEEDTNNLKNELTSLTDLKLAEDTSQVTVSLSKMNIEPYRKSSEKTHEVTFNEARKVPVPTKRTPKLPTICRTPEYVQQKEINFGKTAWIEEKALNIKEELRNLDKKKQIGDSKITNEDLDRTENDQVEKISYDKTITMRENRSKDDHWSIKPPLQNINLNNKDSELERNQYSPLTARNINYRQASMKNVIRSESIPQQSSRKFSKFTEKLDPKDSGGKSTLNNEGGSGEGRTSLVDSSGSVLLSHHCMLSELRAVSPDLASDITDQNDGCFGKRNLFKRKTTQNISLKRERKTKKKCSIM